MSGSQTEIAVNEPTSSRRVTCLRSRWSKISYRKCLTVQLEGSSKKGWEASPSLGHPEGGNKTEPMEKKLKETHSDTFL